MAKHGKQRRHGPQTPWGAKHYPNPAFSLTLQAKQMLRRAADRSGTSMSNVVELLVRRHGEEVTANDFKAA